MAITLKKDKKVVEAVPVTPTPSQIGYLPEEVRAEIEKLPADIQAKFAAATGLTPELVEAVQTDLPETLLETLLEIMEAQMDQQLPGAAPAPAQEVTAQEVAVTDADARKAQRDALKAEILANSKTVPAPAAKVEQPAVDGKPETVKAAKPAPNFIAQGAASMNPFDALFPVDQQVTIVNRGSGHFEVFVGGAAPATVQPAAPKAEEAPAKKEKKVSVQTISNNPAYWTQEYKDFQVEMKEKYADLENRIKLAESLGLVRGKDWADTTKAGQPMPPAIENMSIMNVIREKKGINIYIPEADTTEKRKALVHANS